MAILCGLYEHLIFKILEGETSKVFKTFEVFYQLSTLASIYKNLKGLNGVSGFLFVQLSSEMFQ